MRLSSNPPNDMTVLLSSPDTDTVTVEPTQLTFTANLEDGTAGTWGTAVPVMVTAVRDADAVEETVVVEHRWDPPGATGPVAKMVTVNVDELDTKGVTVSKTEFGGDRGRKQ